MKLAFAAVLLLSIVIALNYVEATEDFEFDGKFILLIQNKLEIKRHYIIF